MLDYSSIFHKAKFILIVRVDKEVRKGTHTPRIAFALFSMHIHLHDCLVILKQ